jgi:hypothetical protein
MPAGFMPREGHPFGIRICPEGLSAQVLPLASGAQDEHATHHAHLNNGGQDAASHGSHHHGVLRSEHCLFGAFAMLGAVPHPAVGTSVAEKRIASKVTSISAVYTTRRFCIHQARAPPSFS